MTQQAWTIMKVVLTLVVPSQLWPKSRSAKERGLKTRMALDPVRTSQTRDTNSRESKVGMSCLLVFLQM